MVNVWIWIFPRRDDVFLVFLCVSGRLQENISVICIYIYIYIYNIKVCRYLTLAMLFYHMGVYMYVASVCVCVDAYLCVYVSS
jgi:hypothetical protein